MFVRLLLIVAFFAPDFSRQMAQVNEALGRGDLASADLAATQLAADFPSRPAVHYVIGIIRLRQDRRGDAEAAFKQALALDPGHREACLELSRLYRLEGRFEEARKTLETGLEKLGPEPSLLLQLGLALAERGDFKEAVRTLRRVPESRATADYWEVVGRVLASAGDFAGAESAYLKLLQQRPGSIPVLRALSGLALKRGDQQKSWDFIAAARREAPNSPDVLYDFAQVSLARYLLSEAINATRLLLLMEPDNLDALFLLGRTLLSGNQAEAAKAVFADYLRQRPDDPNGHMMMGMTLFRSGDFDQARPQFETARRLDPKLLEADYYLGMVAYSLADDATAEGLLTSVVARDPEHGQAHLGLGKLYLRQKKLEQAVSQLQTAARLLNDEPDVHFQLSRVYGQMGQTALAQQEVAAYRAFKAKVDQAKENAADMPFTLGDRRP